MDTQNPLVIEKTKEVETDHDRNVAPGDPIPNPGPSWIIAAVAIVIVTLLILVLWTLMPIATVSVVTLTVLLLLGLSAFLYIRRLGRLERPFRRRLSSR